MRHSTLIVLAMRDGIVLPDRALDWASVLYMAVVVAAFGLFAQTWAQSVLPPTRSAIRTSRRISAASAVMRRPRSAVRAQQFRAAHGSLR